MECPFCKSALTKTYICKGCGADLVILKHLEEVRQKKSTGANLLKSAAPHFTVTQSTEINESSWSAHKLTTEETLQTETSSLSAANPESFIPITDSDQEQENHSSDINTEIVLDDALSTEVRHEIETLFDQLFLSISDKLCVPQSEITSDDLILRERTEQLELLFELLHGSFSSLQPEQESEEIEKSESKLAKSSPRILLPKESLTPLLRTNSDNSQTSSRDNKNELFSSPSAINSIVAAIVDLVLSQVMTLLGILSYERFSLLREPNFATIPGQIFSITILLALFVPSLCLYKAAFFASIGSTPGFLITGIKPIGLDGSKPTRFRLILFSFTAPFVRFFTSPFFLSNRGAKFLIKLTEVRFTVDK